MKTTRPQVPPRSGVVDALASKISNLDPGAFIFEIGPDGTNVRVDLRVERSVRVRGKEPALFSTRRARRMAQAGLRKQERKERKVSASIAQGVPADHRQGASAATSPMMERRDDRR